MMINKRLIGAVPESKKYIAGNVAVQWISLAANIGMMGSIAHLLQQLFDQTAGTGSILLTVMIGLLALTVRFVCALTASRMGYLSSKAVKSTLREAIYKKLLRLGASYAEKVRTSEVVQVAVEGVDQLETYFGAYLPQFFYAMLAPLTLFIVMCFVNVPSAVVLLVCVPMIPVAIAAVQTWAKKLLSKYWGQYTALGDTFLENLQGLTTMKIYQTDALRHERMNEESENFRRITMKVLTMQLNSITIMDLMEKKRTPYRDKFMSMFGIGSGGLPFIRSASVYNQFYSDLVTPLNDHISIPGTTVHCFYAAKMGEKYLARYKTHFVDPVIHRFDMEHEELLVLYPEQWAEKVKRVCL